jgi:hypothetical protein
MSAHAILWRRLDQPGHEAACLVPRHGGWELAGAAVFAHNGEPIHLDYVVVCDSRWLTGSARIRGWVGSTPVALDLVADEARRWHQNAVECPALAGALTSTWALARPPISCPFGAWILAVAEAADVRAAWLEFPTLRLEPLDQRYQRTGLTTYHYQSAGGQFQAELEVNAAGFVTRYPELWQAEAAA